MNRPSEFSREVGSQRATYCVLHLATSQVGHCFKSGSRSRVYGAVKGRAGVAGPARRGEETSPTRGSGCCLRNPLPQVWTPEPVLSWLCPPSPLRCAPIGACPHSLPSTEVPGLVTGRRAPFLGTLDLSWGDRALTGWNVWFRREVLGFFLGSLECSHRSGFL